MIDPTQVQFYLTTPKGRLGPYTSRAAAEIAVTLQPLEEQHQCTIEGKTSDGKTVLLG